MEKAIKANSCNCFPKYLQNHLLKVNPDLIYSAFFVQEALSHLWPEIQEGLYFKSLATKSAIKSRKRELMSIENSLPPDTFSMHSIILETKKLLKNQSFLILMSFLSIPGSEIFPVFLENFRGCGRPNVPFDLLLNRTHIYNNGTAILPS